MTNPIQVWSPYFQSTPGANTYGVPLYPVQPWKHAILAGLEGQTTPQVSGWRAQNGFMQILAYVDNSEITHVQDTGPNGDGTGTYPESAYAHFSASAALSSIGATTFTPTTATDTSGAYGAAQVGWVVVVSGSVNAYVTSATANTLTFSNWNGSQPSNGTAFSVTPRVGKTGAALDYVMNLSDATWKQSRADRAAYYIAQAGYDGVFLDVCGIADLFAGSVINGNLPINPATGVTWTKVDWLVAQNAVIAAVVAGNPGKLVYVNGLADGATYADATNPTAVLYANTNVAMAENWMRSGGTAIGTYPTQTVWQKNIDMLTDTESKARVLLVTTKMFLASGAPGDQAARDAWHMFSFASFLLAAGINSYFSFQYEHSISSPDIYHPWWNTRLGNPLGAYSSTGGVFWRAYDNALVAVNPTAGSLALALSKTYTALDTGVVNSSGSVTLPATSGAILLAPVAAGFNSITVGRAPIATPVSQGASVIKAAPLAVPVGEADASRKAAPIAVPVSS